MKRKRAWIDADFSVDDVKVVPKTSLKAPVLLSSNSSKSTNDCNAKQVRKDVNKWTTSGLWHEIHQPETVQELCLHTKKVHEVSEKLDTCTRSRSNCGKAVVLKGPSGCGKSSVVRAVAKKLNLELKSFKTASGCNLFSDQLTDDSELKEFRSFVLSSANSALCLKTACRSSILWIPELPNVFVMSMYKLECLLDEYLKSESACPIVFEFPESSNRVISFSNKFVMLNRVIEISMNAVAPTFMSKSLQLIGCKLPVNLKKYLSSSMIRRIVDSSAGDLRLAVNMAQMLLLSKRTKFQNSGSSTKDFTLGFFHAVGKVLNPKRLEVSESVCRRCNVNPLSFSLVDLVDCLAAGSQFFVSLVEENFCDFAGSVETFSKCFDDFVVCDLINANKFVSTTGAVNYFETCVHFVCCASVAFWLSQNINERPKKSFAPVRKPTTVHKNGMSTFGQINQISLSRNCLFEIDAYSELMQSKKMVKENLRSFFEDGAISSSSNFFDNSIEIEDYDYYTEFSKVNFRTEIY
ncbi:uncharacterized protein LOC134857231 [Symsagittifera roscoffensis]|uniref:uncharacterized protein LOC134857231 n=1 Tax=Symsagittifera roscoffensis TaxID=84072 RepID=UPI00307C5D01